MSLLSHVISLTVGGQSWYQPGLGSMALVRLPISPTNCPFGPTDPNPNPNPFVCLMGGRINADDDPSLQVRRRSFSS